MIGYVATIKESSRELTAKERIKFKDTSDALSLDELTQENPFVFTPDLLVVLEVHNEKSDNKDYTKYIIVDKGGNKYVTGSESFYSSYTEIMSEMADAMADGEAVEEFEICVYRKESKNYKGKTFITCSIV